MSFLSILKKIGAVITWPIRKTAMLTEILDTAWKDEPEVKATVIGIVQNFEAIDADVVTAIAAGGLNLPADSKAATDVIAFFNYMKNTALPTIEQIYTQLKLDAETTATDPAPAPPAVPAAPAAAAAVSGSALHTQVPA